MSYSDKIRSYQLSKTEKTYFGLDNQVIEKIPTSE